MDPSNSPHSHPTSSSDPSSASTSHPPSTSGSNLSGSNSQPPSTSDPGSASASHGSGSDHSSGSAGETSPSAENNAPELPPEGDSSSSSMQWKSASAGDQPENEEDMDVDATNSSKPTEVLPKSSTGKGKMIDTAGSSGSGREGKAEEIGLLTDLYSLHNKTGRYYFSGGNGQRDFYKFWIQEERDYANKEELDNKINELHARFLKNMDKNVEGPTDPIDVEILRLSEWIWGGEIDSCEETDDDDQEEGNSKDLTDANAVDPNAAGDHGVNRIGSKDSGPVTPINKD